MTTHTEPRGQLIAVCGLHGGAGTTTIAALLAQTAATTVSPVLLTESDPTGGGLGLHLGLTSDHGLADMVAAHAAGSPLPPTSIRCVSDALRICAAQPAPRAPLERTATAEILRATRHLNAMSIVDAGSIEDAHAQAVLPHAQHVLWSVAADADRRRVSAVITSDLTATAQTARWTLVLNDIGRGHIAQVRTALRDGCPTTTATVIVPPLRGLAPSSHVAQHAARLLLTEIR